MDNAYRFVLSRKKIILRYVVAMPLLIPPAFLLAMNISTVVEIAFFLAELEPDYPSGEQYLLLSLLSWAVLLSWATATDSIRRTIARTCWAFSATAFILPVVIIVAAVLSPPDPPDAIFPTSLFVVASLFVGVPLGFLEMILASALSPRGFPEKSIGIFSPARIGWMRIAIMVAVLVIGFVAVRVIVN